MFEGNGNYTRRQLLQATAGAGVLGGSTGAVTGAYLSDREVFSTNSVGTGSFTLELAPVTDDGDELEFRDTSTVPVDLPSLDPGDEGILRTGYRLCEYPGWVWVRTTTDSAQGTGLAEHIDARLLERPRCGDVENERFEGNLADLIDRYEDGLQLGDECISCDPACLDLEWEYDADPPARVSEDSISLSLEFAAVQCRHHENRPESPWN